MKSDFHVKPAGIYQTDKIPLQHVLNWENTLTSHLALVTQSELLFQQRRESGVAQALSTQTAPLQLQSLCQAAKHSTCQERDIWELELKFGSPGATGLPGKHQ